MKYLVVGLYLSYGDFKHSVEDYMSRGWKCQGGVNIVRDDHSNLFYSQAMVLESNDDDATD